MEIIQLFDKYIGPSKTLKKNEHAYHCPFCHHHKPKLQINDKTYKFHCWTCNAGGNLIYLGKRIGMSDLDLSDLVGRCGVSEEVRKKLKDDWSGSIKELLDKITAEADEEETENTSQLFLPSEFKSALELKIDKKNPIEGHAIRYLKDRGITKKHIIKYNIGFCQKGLYAGRVIIPSYDSRNQLNYFIARSIFPDEKQKYKNPPVSKDVIVFGNQIDWKQPIILCEGVFDAIALKRNAIPLLGKFVQKTLMGALKNAKPEVYICLDNDAQEDSLVLYDKIKSYVKSVKTIKLENGKDAGENNFQNILKYQKNSVTLSWETVLREKLLTINSSSISK
jgi:DNA primase